MREKKKPRKRAVPKTGYAALLKNLFDQLPEHRPLGLTDKNIKELGKQTQAIHFRIKGWLRE